MSLDEFYEHYEDYREAPWTNEQVTIAIASLCSLMANIHRKEGAREFTYEDFMPTRKRESIDQVEPTMSDALAMMKEMDRADLR